MILAFMTANSADGLNRRELVKTGIAVAQVAKKCPYESPKTSCIS